MPAIWHAPATAPHGQAASAHARGAAAARTAKGLSRQALLLSGNSIPGRPDKIFQCGQRRPFFAAFDELYRDAGAASRADGISPGIAPSPGDTGGMSWGTPGDALVEFVDWFTGRSVLLCGRRVEGARAMARGFAVRAVLGLLRRGWAREWRGRWCRRCPTP